MIDPVFEEQYAKEHGRSYYSDNPQPPGFAEMIEGANAYMNGDYATALKSFQKAAAKGNTHALFEIKELLKKNKELSI